MQHLEFTCFDIFGKDKMLFESNLASQLL